ncbi:MAG: L-histidine N(alpha)-methyltransferase [Janthinobacterium lividum]
MDGHGAGAATRMDEGRVDAGVVADALAGLCAARKTLPAKLFYDPEGCRLFGLITGLPEYYVTRTERALLESVAPEVAAGVAEGAVLVEYGASDEAKAVLLLDATPRFSAYVPIDVAGPELALLSGRMAQSHPRLAVHPVTADFLAPLSLPDAVATRPRLGFFPGSTIGNLDPAAARAFLREVRATLGRGARFLVGADLRKDPARLVPAYDDAQGVTAAFNRNVLHHLNREAGADFEPEAFAHRALWNEALGRIEMHLVSLRTQEVRLGGRVIRFEAGETIHTENSYKHTVDGLRALAAEAGWTGLRVWTDPEGLFSIHLLGESTEHQEPTP